MNHEGRDGLLDIFTSSKVRNRVTKIKQDNDLPNVNPYIPGLGTIHPALLAHIFSGADSKLGPVSFNKLSRSLTPNTFRKMNFSFPFVYTNP